MSQKLVPSDPSKVMVIREVVPRVVTTFSVPFWRFGRIKVGGRGTIGTSSSITSTRTANNDQVRLQSGSLAVFSPVALTDEVKAKVAELGEVRYICAPDAEVHLSPYPNPYHTNASSTTSSSAPGTRRIPKPK